MGEAEGAAQLPYRLLVVDDEANILELLRRSLRLAGFDVETATNGVETLELTESYAPDLLVLDVMLPDISGFDVVKQLRAADCAVPVLFLSARDDTEDRVFGLTVGGDDYLTKPFSLEELIARIRSVLKRTGRSEAAPSHKLVFADLELDTDSHEVRRAGHVVLLSPTEYELLRYFMANPGRVLSKAQILAEVWNQELEGEGGVIESYVSYLRRKIDIVEPRLLHTLRGVGYVLRLPPS